MPFSDAIRIGASGAGDYEVERSLRFNRDDDAYLQATLGNSNLNKWTLSIWVKKPVNGEHQAIFSSGDSSVSTMVNFDNSDRLKFTNYPGSAAGVYITTRKFRDPSAWYHIVAIWDSGNSTAGDRIRLYVNGVRETAFDQSDNPNQDQDSVINGNTQGDSTWGQGKHRIGRYSNYADNSGCYYAEVNFIDGQAYDPSSFAETDAVTGEYKPKKYTGGYGTNGFYLNFSDNSGTTATTLGKDSSGNGNNFTLNNLVTGDSVKDTPTNNFATFRLYGTPASSGASLAEGNLKFTTGSSGSARNLNRQGISTFLPTSGKWYAEVRVTGGSENNFIGVSAYQVGISPSSNNSRYVYYYGPDGQKYVNTNGSESNANHGAGYGNNDIVGIYIDMDAGTPTVYFSKNGQWADGSGNSDESTPTSGITLGDTFFTTDTGGHTGIGIVVSSSSSGGDVNYQANFGQDSTFSGLTTAGGNTDANGKGDFKYTVPANALAMCSANLADPTILLPNKHFDILTWTGDGATSKAITGLSFTPDFVWTKRRSGADNHHAFDSVRGASSARLFPNLSNAEDGNFNSINSFDSNGFTVGNNVATNANGETFVAWAWKAGGSTVTNNDGANASQVRANTTAGFSIVTYTGTGSTTTFGHGLGVAPQVVITKARSDTSSWAVLHTVGDPTAENRLLLNDNGAYSSYQGYKLWNDTVPTSSVFTVREDAATNASSETYVAYCFSEVSSFSKFGKYIGNGDNDGTFVYTGFKVKWLLIKRTSAEHWILADTARNSVSGRKSPADSYLLASASNAESTGIIYDMLSNGVKFKSNSQNESGSTYIYMAFAESPFKYARAR